MRFERPKDRADELRAKADGVRYLEIPEHRFVMIDGEGPAGGAAFEARLPGLYATAYRGRFALKERGIVDKVGPLEGLWWTESGETDLDVILGSDRSGWRWTLMIVLPDEATERELASALEAGRAKLSAELRDALRIEPFQEGRVAQTLHVGPYTEERPSIERLHGTLREDGLRERGLHHELYIGDSRRSAPDKLRTILRHPVEAA